ncbi:MAG TPA: hypothetical protein VFQ79_22765 [Bryobacteraceae bacterium]|nr:hypothetical protein [Bryobacteraceae bacterium]
MKYWGYLVAKSTVAAVLIYTLWRMLWVVMPEPGYMVFQQTRRFGQDLWWTTAILVLWLLSAALIYLIIWDQRRRCRTCLRRLRMPVETGSWKNLLLIGPPRTEYICPYGHGTLSVPELHITGMESPDWQPHEDIWAELYGTEETRK